MTRFARRVWNSPAKIHNIKSRKHRVEMRLNNVYAVGEYFFIDFSVENKTNIRFDIDEPACETLRQEGSEGHQ